MIGVVNLTDDSRFNYRQKGFTSIINGFNSFDEKILLNSL